MAIKPPTLRNKILGVLLFFVILPAGCVYMLSGESDNAPPVAAPTQSAAFDVPSLVGMNVDQIRTTLGTSQDGNLTEPTALQLEMGTTEWDNTFEKDGQSLLVTFNPRTRAVIDFFISTTDPSGATRDKAGLLATGNLSESDSRYSVEFVRALNDSSVYTGVTAVPR